MDFLVLIVYPGRDTDGHVYGPSGPVLHPGSRALEKGSLINPK